VSPVAKRIVEGCSPTSDRILIEEFVDQFIALKPSLERGGSIPLPPPLLIIALGAIQPITWTLLFAGALIYRVVCLTVKSV